MDVIDTSVMPGDDIFPDAIDSAAGKIRSSGKKVSKSATATHTQWQKLSGVYHAPEQADLYHAMNPVKTDGETFASDLDLGASALETFAETVRTIKAAVVKIRAAAKAFEAKIAEDGTIAPGPYNPYAGGPPLRKQWNEDHGMVNEQKEIAGQMSAQWEALRTAEITCANSLADITGAAHVPTSGPGAPPPAPKIAEAQWYLTAPIDRKENCGEQVVNAVVVDFIGGSVMGALGYLGVSWSPTTGKFGNWWDTFSGSWSGLNKLVQAVNPVWLVLDHLPDPDSVAAERAMTRKAFLGEQVSIDPYAADPQHRYKEAPYRAWTNTVLNVGSWLVPPLKALTAAKLGKSVDLASDAAKASDLAKAGEATRFASAADLVKALRESSAGTRLGSASDMLKTRVSNMFGKSSELSTALRDFETPQLSHYDMTTNHGDPHPVTPPVRDLPSGSDHTPGSGARPETHTDRTPDSGARPETHSDRTADASDRPGKHSDPVTQPSRSDVPGTDETTRPGSDGDGRPVSSAEQPGTSTEVLDQPGIAGPADPAHPQVPVADDAMRQADRHDPDVVKQVAEAKDAVQPRLKELADEAWKTADDKTVHDSNNNLTRYGQWKADHGGKEPTAGVRGSWAHKDLADAIENEFSSEASGYRVRQEASFDLDGNPVRSGAPESVRPDIVLEREKITVGPNDSRVSTWEPVHVWDYKTGKARITGAWRDDVADRLDIPKSAIERLGVG